MSIRRLTPLLALTLLSACANGSDEGSTFHLGIPHIGLPHFGGSSGGKGVLQKDAEAGKPVQLWGDTSLGDDCVPTGETKLDVISAPVHGEAVVKPGRMYAVYPEGDRHAACSGRLVSGMLAIYTAEAGYVGPDQVLLRAVTADGAIQQVLVNIDVSPARVRTPVARRRPSAAPPPLPPIAKPTIRDPDAPAPTVLQTPYPGG